MHTVFALLCFVVVIHWLIFPYPSGLLHWHCGNLTIAPVPARQPWWIWINTSFEFIMNDYIPTTKQSTTKPCAYFLGYIVSDQATEIKCMMVLHPVHRVPLCIKHNLHPLPTNIFSGKWVPFVYHWQQIFPDIIWLISLSTEEKRTGFRS